MPDEGFRESFLIGRANFLGEFIFLTPDGNWELFENSRKIKMSMSCYVPG
jgi:hypothetical protein